MDAVHVSVKKIHPETWKKQVFWCRGLGLKYRSVTIYSMPEVLSLRKGIEG